MRKRLFMLYLNILLTTTLLGRSIFHFHPRPSFFFSLSKEHFSITLLSALPFAHTYSELSDLATSLCETIKGLSSEVKQKHCERKLECKIDFFPPIYSFLSPILVL